MGKKKKQTQPADLLPPEVKIEEPHREDAENGETEEQASSVPSVPSVAADDQKPPRQYTPNPVVTEIPIACPRCKSTKSKKPQPVFSTEQLADARQRAHIAIPDGPELLIIQEADDVYACWWISPLDEAESRLPKSEYPDAEDVADALEDVQYYATQHGHGIIHPNVCEE